LAKQLYKEVKALKIKGVKKETTRGFAKILCGVDCR